MISWPTRRASDIPASTRCAVLPGAGRVGEALADEALADEGGAGLLVADDAVRLGEVCADVLGAELGELAAAVLPDEAGTPDVVEVHAVSVVASAASTTQLAAKIRITSS